MWINDGLADLNVYTITQDLLCSAYKNVRELPQNALQRVPCDYKRKNFIYFIGCIVLGSVS